MDKQETRRINPIAHITTTAVVILVIFELLIVFGAMRLEARTVAKYAPWAYEPFLRLVGEHPESAPRWAAVEEAEETAVPESQISGVAGLQPTAIPMLTETNAVSSDTGENKQSPAASATEDGDAPDKKAPKKQEEIVPVG